MRGVLPFLKDAWRLARPYYSSTSDERWFARGLLLVTVAMRFILVGMSVLLSYWNNAFFTSLQDKDATSFINLLFWYKPSHLGLFGYLPGFCEIAVIYILLSVYRVYLVQLLQIRWRRWMTRHFLGEWMADRAYYRISLRHGTGGTAFTDNPDQRIAEDLSAFIGDAVNGTQGILYLGVDFIANIISLLSFLTILWTLSGNFALFGYSIPGYMVWVAIIYAVVGTVLTHFVGRKLVPLNFRKQRVEADFRFALVRVRENTEGIALYGGEELEKRTLLDRFSALAANWYDLMKRYKFLNALTAGYGQVASVFPIVVAAPRYFAGLVPLGALTQTADSFGQVQGAMSWFVDNYSTIAAWRATVERLTTFQRAIEMAHQAAAEGVRTTPTPGESYALRDARIDLPDGHPLMANVNVELSRGRPILITGRSGAGKSTLFRALAGIWPFGAGQVQRGTGTTLFLPQRPYFPLGTLRFAVAYPHDANAYSDADIRSALEDAGVGHLGARLDEEDNWTLRLSGGEQQRLALARALLAKPDWLFLDEATASLDPESEAALYETVSRRLPDTTVVSIAHRPALSAYHDRHLVVQRGPEGPGRVADVPAKAAE
jgi:vitamin B12/bleomycin/antimicrobial peptide transport system ATP-binding/permease protein